MLTRKQPRGASRYSEEHKTRSVPDFFPYTFAHNSCSRNFRAVQSFDNYLFYISGPQIF